LEAENNRLRTQLTGKNETDVREEAKVKNKNMENETLQDQVRDMNEELNKKK